MHVVNKHNAEHGAMVQCARVHRDILAIPQPLVARTEIVDLAAVIGVLMRVSTLLVNVTGASLTIISLHSFNTEGVGKLQSF